LRLDKLPGKRFAVIVDEAHSSQSGESTKSLKAVLATSILEEAEAEEAEAETPEEELENIILAEMEKRGHQPNLSSSAFTTTPKRKTLELFGRPRRRQVRAVPSVQHAPGNRGAVYTRRADQLHDVYVILAAVEVDRGRPALRPAQGRIPAEIVRRPAFACYRGKVRICVEHFAAQVQGEIGGRAKAMMVTRSRKHAVRFKLAIDEYLAERGYPFEALVAFSGQVEDIGGPYTEPRINGIPEAQTAKTFEFPEYRFLIVANNFQTGFDQPLLHTMYVDKKLGGVNAVQTLSRLNRTHPEKTGTMVLDFANNADEIKAAFEDYYKTMLLSEATDPNLLYEVQTRLRAFSVYTDADRHAFEPVFQPENYARPDLCGARPGGRTLQGAVERRAA
jgi:type I restriction enzyme, R subunit